MYHVIPPTLYGNGNPGLESMIMIQPQQVILSIQEIYGQYKVQALGLTFRTNIKGDWGPLIFVQDIEGLVYILKGFQYCIISFDQAFVFIALGQKGQPCTSISFGLSRSMLIHKSWISRCSLMISTIEMIISLTVLGSFVEIESLFCPLGDWHCQYLHMHHIIPTSLWQP